MHPVVRLILTDLSEANEPMSWIALFNGVCPYPAVELFDIFTAMRDAGVIEAAGANGRDCYVITDAGRAMLAANAEEDADA